MSLGSALKSALGFIAGILIPGVSKVAVEGVHEVQQHFAEIYGVAAQKLAEQLKLDTTGMSGPDKVFYILKALIATAKSQGFKGDEKVLGDTLLDVAQTAYRASVPEAESAITGLITSLHLATPLTMVAELVLPALEQKAEGALAGILHLDAGQEAPKAA